MLLLLVSLRSHWKRQVPCCLTTSRKKKASTFPLPATTWPTRSHYMWDFPFTPMYFVLRNSACSSAFSSVTEFFGWQRLGLVSDRTSLPGLRVVLSLCPHTAFHLCAQREKALLSQLLFICTPVLSKKGHP